MGKFDGILICTDLDGTLFKNDKSISNENLEAMEYFKSEGGKFTFITGRMPFFVTEAYQAVKPNAPFGCVNGGGLYDGSCGKYIWRGVMADGVLELIRHIDEKFTDVGIQVNTYDKLYFSRENQTMKHFREVTGMPNLICHYDEVREPIAKIVFGSESDEVILAIEAALRSHPLASKFDFIRSERTLFEILPKGICKGVSITKLCEHLGIDISKSVAIGDYNNDISMFRAAGVGIAVANAVPEAKAAADYVTVSNEESAIAKVILDLEKGKFAQKCQYK